MQRNKLHIVTLIKNLLCAIAMVIVDIKHRHFGASRARHMMGCDRRIVEKAISAIKICRRMMPWWSAQTITIFCTVQNNFRRAHRHIYGATRCFICTHRQRRRSLEAPPTQFSVNRLWLDPVAHIFAQI